uniref:Uncharacterized protein n=1 Tax=Rodentolepis nana TaxID=102285 RepID=A0A0R3TMA7_RODNA
LPENTTNEDLFYLQGKKFEQETNVDTHGSGNDKKIIFAGYMDSSNTHDENRPSNDPAQYSILFEGHRQSNSGEPSRTALEATTTEIPISLATPYQVHSNGDALEIVNRATQFHSDNGKNVTSEFDNEPNLPKIKSELINESTERPPNEQEYQISTTEREFRIEEKLATEIDDPNETGETSSDFTTSKLCYQTRGTYFAVMKFIPFFCIQALDLISTDEIPPAAFFKQREEKNETSKEMLILSPLITDSVLTANSSEAHALKSGDSNFQLNFIY